MLPNRADYKNKKDYKWARKQAQREEIATGTGIASARGWASFLTFFGVAEAGVQLGLGAASTVLGLIAGIVVFRLVPPAPMIKEQNEAKKREEQERGGPPWKNGTKVNTASGKQGVVKKPVANRPGYFHVQFDDGTMSQIRQVSKAKLDEEKQAPPAPEPAAVPTQPAPSSMSAELQRLTDLHRTGSLTAEEFEAAKAKVLAA